MSFFPKDPLATALGLSGWQHDAVVMGAYYSHSSKKSNKTTENDRSRAKSFAEVQKEREEATRHWIAEMKRTVKIGAKTIARLEACKARGEKLADAQEKLIADYNKIVNDLKTIESNQ